MRVFYSVSITCVKVLRNWEGGFFRRNGLLCFDHYLDFSTDSDNKYEAIQKPGPKPPESYSQAGRASFFCPIYVWSVFYMAMIEVQKLHKWYGDFHVLQGITESVNKGEVLGHLWAVRFR